jgi:hypothetical protein
VVQVSTLLSIKQVVAQKTVAIVQQQDTTSVEGNDLMTVKLKHKLYEQNLEDLQEFVWELHGEM